MDFKATKTVKTLGWFFVLISIVYTFYASFSQRGLFLDGSYYMMYLLDNISNNDFSVFISILRPRAAVEWLQQFPTVFLGIVLGIKSKLTLSTIFSLTLFLTPLLALFWNYQLTKRTKEYGILFWSIFTYCIMILLYQIFALVETIIGIPFQFVLLNYLFGKINYTKFDKIGIAFLILLMFGIYEHTVLLGVIMFAGTFLAVFDEENPKNMFVKVCIGAGSIAASFYTAFFMILTPNERSEGIRFLKEWIDFWPYALNLNIILSLLSVFLIVILLFKNKTLNKKVTAFISFIYLFVFLKMINHLGYFLDPMREMHMRSIVCWAVPLIFFGIVLFKYKNKKLVDTQNKEIISNEKLNIITNNAYIPVLLCGITLTGWQIVHTYYWNQNISYMKKELANCSDILYIPHEHEEISSFFNNDLRRYIWKSNYPSTALMYDENYKIQKFLMVLDYSEETEGDIPRRENLYSVIEKGVISIPYNYRAQIVNKFWDLTDVAVALEKYNNDNDIQTNKSEYLEELQQQQ